MTAYQRPAHRHYFDRDPRAYHRARPPYPAGLYEVLAAEAARMRWASFPNVGELPPAGRAAFLDELAQLVEDAGGVVDDPRTTAIYQTRPRRAGQAG